MGRPPLPPTQVKRNTWGVALTSEEEVKLDKIRGNRKRSVLVREALELAYPSIFGTPTPDADFGFHE